MKIIENIHKELLASELSGDIGLLSGTSGVALFLVYYDRIIRWKNEINPRVMEVLEHNIRCIDSGNHLYTICSGISGFGWLCEHLRKLKVLSREDIEFLDDLDPFLYKQMMTDIKQGNYDYLHGALGVGTYFLSRFDKQNIPEYMKELLIELEKSAIPCENGAVKWISLLSLETGRKGYNISLSHGMSSIAAFLVRLYRMNFETERVEKLLIGTIKYILDQVTYTEGSISYFPSHSIESSKGNYDSRLGWCYGDLGIAYILWKAGIVLRNKEWENFAIQVLLHNANRRDLQENAIRDAGLCHGSAGVAHIFWNMYRNTQIQAFQDATNYWLDITAQMGKYPDGLAGFKAWHTEEYGGFIKSDSLLEGIAGIGLALLSHLAEEKTTWDECLMLS
jgi:lantibiotic modifying enzyme